MKPGPKPTANARHLKLSGIPLACPEKYGSGKPAQLFAEVVKRLAAYGNDDGINQKTVERYIDRYILRDMALSDIIKRGQTNAVIHRGEEVKVILNPSVRALHSHDAALLQMEVELGLTRLSLLRQPIGSDQAEEKPMFGPADISSDDLIFGKED